MKYRIVKNGAVPGYPYKVQIKVLGLFWMWANGSFFSTPEAAKEYVLRSRVGKEVIEEFEA